MFLDTLVVMDVCLLRFNLETKIIQQSGMVLQGTLGSNIFEDPNSNPSPTATEGEKRCRVPSIARKPPHIAMVDPIKPGACLNGRRQSVMEVN